MNLQQILKKLGEHAKNAYACFDDLKISPGFHENKLEGFWRNLLLMAICCWLSSNCIPAQTFVSTATALSQNCFQFYLNKSL